MGTAKLSSVRQMERWSVAAIAAALVDPQRARTVGLELIHRSAAYPSNFYRCSERVQGPLRATAGGAVGLRSHRRRGAAPTAVPTRRGQRAPVASRGRRRRGAAATAAAGGASAAFAAHAVATATTAAGPRPVLSAHRGRHPCTAGARVASADRQQRGRSVQHRSVAAACAPAGPSAGGATGRGGPQR